jgi:hypothetical protein
VLDALTRKFKLCADVDLAGLARACPPTLSGADLYALCADAWMLTLKRHIAHDSTDGEAAEQAQNHPPGGGSEQQQQQQQEPQEPQEPQEQPQPVLEVTQQDFVQALAALTPSLSREDIARYEAIKQHYDSQQGFGGGSGSRGHPQQADSGNGSSSPHAAAAQLTQGQQDLSSTTGTSSSSSAVPGSSQPPAPPQPEARAVGAESADGLAEACTTLAPAKHEPAADMPPAPPGKPKAPANGKRKKASKQQQQQQQQQQQR